MRRSLLPLTIAALAMTSGLALAQTGASPADPMNERNQRPAPSNIQPADPAADTDPAARIPTDPGDAAVADRQGGGAAGGATDYGALEGSSTGE